MEFPAHASQPFPVEMRYQPERALTPYSSSSSDSSTSEVEMRYQPERALTRFFRGVSGFTIPIVENASSACPRQKTSKRKIKETIKKPFSDVPHQERLLQRKDKVKEKTNA